MSVQNQNNLNKKLVTLMSVASSSIFFAIPALALINSNSSNIDGSLNNRSFGSESTHSSRQLLAQGTSGTGGTGTSGTGTSQTGTGGTGTGGFGNGQTGTGGTGAGGFGNGQTGTGGTGAGGFGTGQTGTGGTGTGGFGTGQTGTGGMGTGQTGTGGTGTGGMGTGQTGTGGTGTGGMGTGQTGTGQRGAGQTGAGGNTSGNGQANRRQDAFTQSMLAGYAATQQRDYSTALTYFQRALQLRPNNPYARRAVRNVQGYMQRGTTATPNNAGSVNTRSTNQRSR